MSAMMDFSTTRQAEVRCKYKFGYRLKSVDEQVEYLRDYDSRLKNVSIFKRGELPIEAEEWFAIPNIWKGNYSMDTYYNAVLQVLDRIKKESNGNFYNYSNDQLSANYLHQSAYTAAQWHRISADQGHSDILLIACQLGGLYRNDSVRQALKIMLAQNQFGPGLFATGIMLLTHSDRLCCCDDLEIDCAGDECGSRCDQTPYFGFVDGRVVLDTCPSNLVTDRSGSASAFLPNGL